MAAPPRVSVVVPHYNDLARLDLALTALQAQRAPSGGFEVIVADNDSPIDEAELRRVIGERARLTIVRQKGAGPARNGGVALARGEVLAFTDADCIPEPGWLNAGLAALETVDLVGGAMRVLVDDPDHMTPVEAFESVFAFDNRSYVERQGFTVTANLFCRRDTFERVGPFATTKVSEDLEWCHRARSTGFTIGYAPEAVVGHPARRTWPELIAKTRRIADEAHGLASSSPGGWRRWFVRTLALPASAIAHTPKALFSAAAPRLSSRLAATAVLYRVRLWRFGYGLRLLARPRES